MKHLFFLSFFVCSVLFADTDTCQESISLVDFPVIKNFVTPFRTMSMKEKLKYLKIKGDVRADFLARREKEGNIDLRGGSAHDKKGVPIPSDQIAAKFNFRFDYQCDDSWAVAHLEFDNATGTELLNKTCKEAPELLFGSGFCNYLCLKRAYVGYVFWKTEEERLWAELGRRSLYYVFDSRVQFKARVDGGYLKYSNTFAKYEEERSSNFYVVSSCFLISQKCNHFGYAAETGIYNVCDSGFDWKLSFINWRNNGHNECGVRDPLGWRFQNGQLTGDYNFRQRFFGKKLNLYGAFLYNFAASRVSFSTKVVNGELVSGPIENPQRENRAFYLGFILGEVKKQGDFSFESNYQYVEAQAVPDCDIRGIGRGNARRESFPRNRRGNSNYKGFHNELLYAITDKLSVDLTFDIARSVDKNIGPTNLRYHKIECEFIHSF